MDKIPIELTPNTAVTLCKFLMDMEEYFKSDERFTNLENSSKEFQKEVYLKITDEQLADATQKLRINQSLGYDPLN